MHVDELHSFQHQKLLYRQHPGKSHLFLLKPVPPKSPLVSKLFQAKFHGEFLKYIFQADIMFKIKFNIANRQ